MNVSNTLKCLKEKWEWLAPLVIFSAALAARLYLLFTHRYPMMIHEQDATGYMAVAENIRSFRPFFDSIRPPTYPLFIALFSLLPIDLELAARVASVFMDALTVIPLYWLGRITLCRSGAATAAILWGFFSFSLYFSVSPLSQSTFLFFLCCAILCFVRGTEKEEWRSGYLFFAGALFSLSYQARPEGVVPFAAAGAISLFFTFVTKAERSKLRGTLLLVAGFLLVAGPYLVFLRSQVGYWTVTAKSDLALKAADGLLILDSHGNLPIASNGMGVWKEYYGSFRVFFRTALTNASQFAVVFYRTFPLWVHLLAVIGAVVLIVRKQWRMILCLTLLATATLPVYVANLPKTHSYLYALFPVLFLLYAAFWDSSAEFVVRMAAKHFSFIRSSGREAAVAVLVILPAALLAFFSFGQARAALENPSLVHEALLTEKVFQKSGWAVRDVSQPTDKIMTRWGLIGYFAGRNVVTLPKGGVKEVVDYGRKNGARFLIIDTVSVLSRRQELIELLDPLKGRQINRDYGLEPLNLGYDPEFGGYVIYRYNR